MKIYTKTGDEGETGLFGGSRVPKDHLRIHAYGTLDELNAVLGVVMTQLKNSNFLFDSLQLIQEELFQLGAELATPASKKNLSDLIETGSVTRLEKGIDEFEESLQPLKNFILPGGGNSSALLHLARTVCRRAEREVIALHHQEGVRPEVLEYLNRLSDYLFVAARHENHLAHIEDRVWKASKKKG